MVNTKLCWIVLVVLGLAAVCVVPSSAVEDRPHISWITLENGYIGVALGDEGAYEYPSPGHFFYGGLQPISGRFDIWRTAGDPTTLDDDGMPMIFSYEGPPAPGDRWAAWQIMVDTWTDDDPPEHVWAEFERGGTSGSLGDEQTGWWTIFPYTPTNEKNLIRGVCYPRASEPDEVILPIRCELELRLMRDTVRFKWTLKNEGSVDRLVGLRVYADFMPSPEHTGTQDLRNIISIPGHPLVEKRTLLSDKDIPPAIEMFNSQKDPVMSIRTTLKDQDATPPDKVGIDDWWATAADAWSYWYSPVTGVPDPFMTWTYEPIPYQYIDDIGYGAFWKPRRLWPGQSTTIIHYIGLACATSDFTKPNLDKPQYVAAVQGPRCLKYYKPTDPLDSKRLDPEPFTISAYLYNTEKYVDLDGPSFTLTLPDGLELVDPLDPSQSEKYTKSLTTIKADTEGAVSWQVRPVGRPTGILNYSISYDAAPVGGTTISREINIPATEWQPLPAGWQMISVPFTLKNPDPGSSLGLNNSALTYVFWRYDPYLRKYQPVYKLVPGEAYWLKLNRATEADLTQGTVNPATPNYEPIQWEGTQGTQVPLEAGWNMVGNPYLYTVRLGELRFYYREYGTLDYDQAVARNLISKTVFWWDPAFRKYRWSSERAVQFKPWQGYWVYALRQGVTMIVSPAAQVGASIGGQPSSTGGDPPAGP